jgi:hypothetical protein
MLAWIAYSFLTFAAGMILAFLLALFIGGPSQRADKPHRLVLFCLVLAMGGPFAYVEVLTQMVGDPLFEKAIKQAYNDSPIQGPMQYYKVTTYSGTHATALVIGQEKQGWGGTDRPVIQVSLIKDGEKWKPESFKVVCSSRLNKDGLVFPPYQ